jgi:membrane protein
MQFKWRHLGGLFKTTFQSWVKKDPFGQSAVIAYYAIFSIPGLLVLVITAAGFFYGKDAATEGLMEQVSLTMGAETATQIEDILIHTAKTKSSIWASILGVVILLVGATGVFVELQKALNQIWEVEVIPRKGIVKILRARLFSFGLILAIAFLLLISLAVSTLLAAMTNWITNDTSAFMTVVFTAMNLLVSFAFISVLFAMMFKILPDARIKWKHVWLGSIVTGILFTLGKTALAFYFGKANPASGYGAAGSIILILLWVSYSSMILFFGAEFTAAYARKYDGKIPAIRNSKKIKSKV